jgi:hypothetical protein
MIVVTSDAGGVDVSPGATESSVVIWAEEHGAGGHEVSPGFGAQGGVWVSPANAVIASTDIKLRETTSLFRLFMFSPSW